MSTRRRKLSRNGWTAAAQTLAAMVCSWGCLTADVTAQTPLPTEPDPPAQGETNAENVKQAEFSPERESSRPAPPPGPDGQFNIRWVPRAVQPIPAVPPEDTQVQSAPLAADPGGSFGGLTVHGAASPQPAEAPPPRPLPPLNTEPVTVIPASVPVSAVPNTVVPGEKQTPNTPIIVINGNPANPAPPVAREVAEPVRQAQDNAAANGMLEITIWHGVIAVAAFGFGSVLTLVVGLILLRRLSAGNGPFLRVEFVQHGQPMVPARPAPVVESHRVVLPEPPNPAREDEGTLRQIFANNLKLREEIARAAAEQPEEFAVEETEWPAAARTDDPAAARAAEPTTEHMGQVLDEQTAAEAVAATVVSVEGDRE